MKLYFPYFSNCILPVLLITLFPKILSLLPAPQAPRCKDNRWYFSNQNQINQQDNYIQILVPFKKSTMIQSENSLNNTQDHSSFCGDLNSGRQSLSRACPARKLITKREGLKKCQKKAVTKKARHIKHLATGDCQSMLIQETTQQGLNSSCISKESVDSDGKELTSIGFYQPIKQRNSNFGHQRTSQMNEYLPLIEGHMREKELLYVPKFIADPNSVSQSSRTKLMTWIFDLSSRFQFKLQTCFSAVNIVDRALGRLEISLEKLPLLGITALFMATKYEQILIPHIANFVIFVPQIYKVTKQAVLNMEGVLLNALNFDFGYISPLLFINHSYLSFSLPTFVRDRSIAIAKQLTLSSACRYWPSSKLAAYAIFKAQQEYQKVRHANISGVSIPISIQNV